MASASSLCCACGLADRTLVLGAHDFGESLEFYWFGLKMPIGVPIGYDLLEEFSASLACREFIYDFSVPAPCQGITQRRKDSENDEECRGE